MGQSFGKQFVGDSELIDLFSYHTTKESLQLNVCELSSLYDTSALKPDSASNSQIIFGNLIQSVNGHNGHVVSYGLNVNKKIPIVIKAFIKNKSNSDNSLETEAAIYEDYADYFITNYISPNFVGFVAYGECNKLLSQINDAIKNKIMPQKDADILINGFERIASIWKQENPGFNISIDDQVVSILMTTKVVNFDGSPSDKIGDFIPDSSDELLNITTQLLYSLNVMESYNLVHNDLHLGNVLVEKLEKPEWFVFIVDLSHIIIMRTKYIPKIYDFDRSAGMNPVNYLQNNLIDPNGPYCIKFGECQSENYKRDVYMLFCFLSLNQGEQYTWLFELFNRSVSSQLYQQQLLIHKGERMDLPCRIRNSDPTKGVYIPGDYENGGMKNSYQILTTDPLFTKYYYRADNLDQQTVNIFKSLRDEQIYATVPEHRQEFINYVKQL